VRFRPDLRALAVLALLTVAAPALPAAPTPDAAEVERAVKVVKADPNLANERTVRSLTWDDDGKKKARKSTRWPEWLGWIGALFMWIAQASNALVWLLLAALAALLVMVIVRIFASNRLSGRGGTRFIAPTHVQDLDIRPESLPPDIGAAARALWDRGEQRAALALLYRGLLSRLAHVHEVPIRDSSTEGDCLALAARKLDPARIAYATELVRTWQRAIYGGLSIDTAVIHSLCAGFAANLDAPPGHAQARPGFAAGAAA
jgi:hypothetical protein